MSSVNANPLVMLLLSQQMLAKIKAQIGVLDSIAAAAKASKNCMDTDASAQLSTSVSELLKYTESHRKSLEKYAQFLRAAAEQYTEADQALERALLCRL